MTDSYHLERGNPLRDYLEAAAQTGQVPPAAELAALPCTATNPAAWRTDVARRAAEVAEARSTGAHGEARALARDVPAGLALVAGAAEPEPEPDLSPDEIAARVRRF